MDFPKNYNIILINIDGFRRDKIDLCPTLKELTEQSYYFSNVSTVAPYTFASLHSVFSGTYPSRNGVNSYYSSPKFKKNEIKTLPELLKKDGYYTSCDVISKLVIPNIGFDDWNIFDEETVDFISRHTDFIKRLAKKEKFFLFLHYTDMHKHLVRKIVSKYKQESNDDEYFSSQKENNTRFNALLPSCDDYVSAIIQILKDTKIYDKTVLIFFSDHGTSIGEKKGEKFYGVYVYDYTVNVFCILKIPNHEPKIIENQCSTIDIFPTIAEIIKQPLEHEFSKIQGKSLFSLIENPSENHEVFVETGGLYGPWPSPKRHNVFCIKIDNKKLIYNDTPQTWEFYDLLIDPSEQNNIYAESSDQIRLLKNKLITYMKENNISTKIS
jgi:arylsulfatase A-like enzyme